MFSPLGLHSCFNFSCGLSSRFGTEFPSQLTGKLAPEELEETLRRVNFAISRTMNGHGRWLLCGLFFCCCTCGCSLLPTYYLSNRVRYFISIPMLHVTFQAVSAVRKTLDHENQELYNKLGLHWTLSRRSIEGSGTLVEYVLVLDFLPKVPLNMPD